MSLNAPGERNARHMPWLPVRYEGGSAVTLVGIDTAIADAPRIADLGTEVALERSALLRFLESATVVALRHAGIDRLSTMSQWPSREQVATALDALGDIFCLDGRDTPFLQEWHHKGATKRPFIIEKLPFHRPGASTKVWAVPNALREPTQPTDGDLALALVCHWFHDFGGNAQSLNGNRPINGCIGAKVGVDSVIFWEGPTLAHTLAANTPHVWLTATDLPAWADRPGTTAPTGTTSGVWFATFNPNAILIEWEAATAKASHYAIGLSQYSAPGASGPAALKLAAQIKLNDPHRFTVTKETKKSKTVDLFSGIRPEHAPLLNLRGWHEQNMAVELTKRTSTTVLAPERTEGVEGAEGFRGLAEDGWQVAVLAVGNTGATPPSYKHVEWLRLRPSAVALDAPAAAGVQRTFEAVAARLALIGFSLSIAGFDSKDFPYMRAQANNEFYRAADYLIEGILTEHTNARRVGKPLNDAISDAVRVAFDQTVQSYEYHPKYESRIASARGSLDRALYNLDHPNIAKEAA